MQCIIKDFKVDVLPTKGVPNSRYYVPNGNGTNIDEYVTDKDGEFHKVCCGEGGGSGEESDPIALSKTITLLEGNAIEIVGTASQTLSTDPSWTIHHGNTSSVANLDTSGAQVIDTVTFDTYGHVLTVTTRNLTLDDLGYVAPISGRFGIEDDVAAENRSFDVSGFVFELLGIVQDDGAQQLLALDASSNIVWVDIASITAGGGYSDEQAQDAVFNAIIAGAGISIAYNDVANTFTISHADTSSVTNLDTSTAQVIDTLTFDTFGHVQTVTTRNLTLSDLGYAVPNAYRFGKAGEDTIATESRVFDVTSTHDLTIVNPSASSSYFQLYGGSFNGLTLDMLLIHPSDGTNSGMGASPGNFGAFAGHASGGSNTNWYANSAYAEILSTIYHDNGTTNIRHQNHAYMDSVGANSYVEFNREVVIGSGVSSHLYLDNVGAKLHAKATIGGTYKGITVLSTGQAQLTAYTTSTSFTGTPTSFLSVDSSGNIIQSAIVTSQRFGVSGEDNASSGDRTFSLASNDSFEFYSPTGSDYFGFYNTGGTSGLAMEYSSSDALGNSVFMSGFPTQVYFSSGGHSGDSFVEGNYQAGNNALLTLQAGQLISGVNTVVKLGGLATGVDATSFAQVYREVTVGTGINARLYLDNVGAKLQAKSTIGGTYKGIIVKGDTDLVFENYSSTRADAGSTKAFYAADASGTVAYGPISSTTGQRFGVATEDATATQTRTFNLNGGSRWWEIVDINNGDNYFGVYDQGSTPPAAVWEYYFQSGTGSYATQSAGPFSGWYTSIYNATTNAVGLIQMQAGGIPELKATMSGSAITHEMRFWTDPTDAAAYAEITREWNSGTGNFTRMRLDVDGAKLQSKVNTGGTYQGILVKPNSTVVVDTLGGSGDVIVGADNTGLLSKVSYTDVVAGGQVVIFEWKFSNSVGINNPGTGFWRADSAVGSSVVALSIADITSSTGFDISTLFGQVSGNWLIHIQQSNDATKFIQFSTNTTYIDHTTWWEVPVTYVQSSGFPFSNNTKCTFVFVNENATGTAFTWTEVTGTSQAGVVNAGYILNNAGLVTLTLPSTAVVGSVIEVAGKGVGGWKIAQNSGQTIHFGNTDTTTGATGFLSSTNRYDSIKLLCVTANTDFVILSSIGNITVS